MTRITSQDEAAASLPPAFLAWAPGGVQSLPRLRERRGAARRTGLRRAPRLRLLPRPLPRLELEVPRAHATTAPSAAGPPPGASPASRSGEVAAGSRSGASLQIGQTGSVRDAGGALASSHLSHGASESVGER